MNDPKKIDTFYEMFNSSRCKTAMLILSTLVFFGIVISEINQTPSQNLFVYGGIIIGFWTGRTTKKQDSDSNN